MVQHIHTTDKRNWALEEDGYSISQKVLERIGIGISECELCKEIHRLAQPQRLGLNKWIIVTQNKGMIAHIKRINALGYCDTAELTPSNPEDC